MATEPCDAPADPIEIIGVLIHPLTRRDAQERCRAWLKGEQGRHVVTVNPEFLLRARRDLWFRTVIARADLAIADGIGVRWASAFLRTVRAKAYTRTATIVWFLRTMGAFLRKPQIIPSPIPERVSGSDLLWDISRDAAALGARVYLMGGRRGTAPRAAEELKRSIPGIDAHAFVPDHAATPYAPYDLHIQLLSLAPVVVFIGYGAPVQEEWIHQNLHRYPSIRVAVGVGGALDFLAGNAPRAPSRYQTHGLEWLWRLMHQPWRAWRTVRATVLFPMLVLLPLLRRRSVRP